MKLLDFSVKRPEENEFCWSESYQLLYMLKGSMTISLRRQEVALKPEDFIVINICEPYWVQHSEQAAVLVIEVSDTLLRQASKLPDNRSIRFCSAEYESSQPEEVSKLRQAVANLFALYSREESYSHLRSCSRALALFDELFQSWSIAEDEPQEGRQARNFYYLQQSMRYIRENYQGTVTLEQAAERLGISESSLSRVFRTVLGKRFLDVVQEVRMRHAVAQLRDSSRPITDIAYENGFAGASAFISKFRAVYGMTPKQYRKECAAQPVPVSSGQPAQEESIYQSISKYVDQTIEPPKRRTRAFSVRRLDCDTAKQAGPAVDPFWHRTASIGWAIDGLSAVVQEQIRTAQQEIGFTYLRFHGIFDDDMLLYNEDEQGKPMLNFNYCDMLFDFLQSVGLKPYLELGFIPGKLAQDSHTFDLYHAHICMPNNWEKFDYLVHEFIIHNIHRYGLEEVKTWRFTPMMCNHILYGFFTWQDYMEMYQHIWRVCKSIDPALCIGGPGVDSSVMIHDWDGGFGPWLDGCKEQGCLPDFITVKIYPYDHSQDGTDFWEHLKTGALKEEKNRITDKNYVSHSLQKIHVLLKKYGYTAEQIAVEAWNTTYSQSDPSSDTCYRAAFMAKNILENQHNAWCLTYWALSDHMVDFVIQRQSCSFRGGFGLITYDGVRKSGYYAMQLLAMLRGRMLQSGDGYFIAENNGVIQIVLYQYCDYNLFHGEEFDNASNFENPYYLCKEGELQAYQLTLHGLQAESYTVEQYAVGREHGGNPYECWEKMGKPESLTAWQRSYIEKQAQPAYFIRHMAAQDGKIELKYVVQPHDVLLIELRPEK